MGRKPRVASATVALAGFDVYFVAGAFSVAVDDVFAVVCVGVFQCFVRSRFVGIDGNRLRMTVSQQELNCRFVMAFSGITYHFLVPRSEIIKTGGLPLMYETRPRETGHASATPRRARGPSFRQRRTLRRFRPDRQDQRKAQQSLW